MSGINGISSNLIQSYVTIKSKPDLTLEDMFRMLSFSLGGDGTSITKEQLDDYIDKADSGDLKVDSSRLKALKTMQKNWKTIAGDDDSLSFGDMKAFPMLLISAMFGGISSGSDSKTTDSEVGSYLLENILENPEKDEDKTAKLSALLNKALSGNSDENDDKNADLVATLTNLLAKSSSNTTIEAEV